MYLPHPNKKLQELFSYKPYQGADPANARFLFFGLDANYDLDLENKNYFQKLEHCIIGALQRSASLLITLDRFPSSSW